jgi:hypothetical protein
MMHKFLIAAGAAAFAVLAGAVAAQPAPGGGGPGAFFAQADANHDGNITRAEWDAARAARFALLDANHDGKLTGDEIPHWGGHAGAAAAPNGGPPPGGGGHHGMMNADANGDGVITRAEWDAQSAAIFQRLDANGDGVISAAELQAARDHMHEH